jgi:uncharacterized membrane protein
MTSPKRPFMLPPTTLPPLAARPARIQAIDIVRGLVMVVMALDHVRDFWSYTPFKPDDLSQTTPLFFFTRWITHFCAPTFVFLSGVSMWLAQLRRGSLGAMSRFLLIRGLWLIGLELVLLSAVLQWGYGLLLLLILWALGGSMVLLAGLLWLPRPLLWALVALILLGHDALPLVQPITAANAGWALLHNGPFALTLPGVPPLLVAYSVGPWLGVLLAGYLIGSWFELPLPERVRRLRLTGAALLLLFAGLRLINGYGDPQPWREQPRGSLYTVLSFLNVSKYPPSLLFCCLTLGVALLLLSVAEQGASRPARWLRTYGQVPLFYYLLHLLLVSGVAWVWTRLAFGHPVNLSFTPTQEWPLSYEPSLARCYGVWLAVVLALYWPCRWYQGYKQRHTYWWLSYL